MNILVLVSYNSDILLDVIIKGFVKLGFRIGRELTIYPNDASIYRHSDHLFSMKLMKPDMEYKPDEIGYRLQHKEYDLIIMGSIWGLPYMKDVYNHILSFSNNTPCVIVSEDATSIIDNLDYYGLGNINLISYFHTNSREGEKTDSIPFYVLEEDCFFGDKIIDTFFAGNFTPYRKTYLDKLIGAGYQNIYGYTLITTKSNYLKYLRISSVGFGIYSFDVPQSSNRFRHIETVSQGCALFMKRPVPEFKTVHEFEDGISAIYYNDPDDLLVKLGEGFADREKLNWIARNGYDHVMNYHLDYQGAQYILDNIKSKL